MLPTLLHFKLCCIFVALVRHVCLFNCFFYFAIILSAKTCKRVLIPLDYSHQQCSSFEHVHTSSTGVLTGIKLYRNGHVKYFREVRNNRSIKRKLRWISSAISEIIVCRIFSGGCIFNKMNQYFLRSRFYLYFKYWNNEIHYKP